MARHPPFDEAIRSRLEREIDRGNYTELGGPITVADRVSDQRFPIWEHWLPRVGDEDDDELEKRLRPATTLIKRDRRASLSAHERLRGSPVAPRTCNRLIDLRPASACEGRNPVDL